MANLTKLLVENILRVPTQFPWETQGLGFMRLYLSDEVRMHIWDSSLRVPGVSAIHSHPWDLKSTVIAGRYKQHRYAVRGDFQIGDFDKFNCAVIKCGADATIEQQSNVDLRELDLETYVAGQCYTQTKDEIHVSLPEDGTVTLIERTFHEDRDHAKVYWRGNGSWVDARPLVASLEQIADVTNRSLNAWF